MARSKSTVEERVARNKNIAKEYLTNGMSTLESIGQKHDMTRERVRQIVAKETPDLSQEEISEIRRADLVRRSLNLVEKCLEADGTISTLSELEVKSGVSVEILNSNRELFVDVYNELDKRKRKNRVFNNESRLKKGKRYSDEDIYAALRRVSAENDGKPFSNEHYNNHRTESEPSSAVIRVRMGGLTAVCERIGVPTNPSLPKRSKFTKDNVVQSIAKCSSELGFSSPEMVSFAEYDKWAAATEEAPSGATVRLIFGSWNSARLYLVKSVA